MTTNISNIKISVHKDIHIKNSSKEEKLKEVSKNQTRHWGVKNKSINEINGNSGWENNSDKQFFGTEKKNFPKKWLVCGWEK